MTTETDLKPCPFCGEADCLSNGVERQYEFIFCETCYANGSWKLTTDEAVSAWNTRAGEKG